MQGAVDRSDIYKGVELSLDALIAEHISRVYNAGREIRRAEVGEEIAMQEEKRGGKTDEEYAKESIVRCELREKTRKQEEARKRREEEMERLRAEEKKKKLELEKLRSVDEKRREEEAKEARREKEREAQRDLAKQLEQEKEAERPKRYEQCHTEQIERDADRDLGRDRHRPHGYEPEQNQTRELISDRSPSRPSEKDSVVPTVPPPVDEKALEEAALERLLREGRELVAKSNTSTLERSESLEPPYRKPHLPKSLTHSAAHSKSPLPKHPQPAPKLNFSSANLLHNHPTSHPPRLTPAISRSRSRSRSPDHRHHSADHRHRSPDHRYHDSSHRHRSPEYRHRSPSHQQHSPNYRRHSISRSRSRSWSRSRSISRSRSRSQSDTRYSSHRPDDARHADADAKAIWKQKAVAAREREAELYKRAARDDHRSRSGSRGRDPHSRYSQGGSYREHHHHRHHHHHYHHQHHRSRSRDVSTRRYERSRSPRGSGRKYPDEGGRVHARTSHGHRGRDKSPVDIDRYIPGGGRRDHMRRGGHGARDGEKHRGFVEIDRYVPGGGDKERGRRGDGDREVR